MKIKEFFQQPQQTCPEQSKSFFEIRVKSFSGLYKPLQITAWENRFTRNYQSEQKIIGTHTSSEKTEARLQIKHVQYEVIDTMGIKKLQNNDVITLRLKIDEAGILRCHGRLNNPDILKETKLPIYFPRKNYWTELFVKEFHEEIFHARSSHMLSRI